MHPDDRTDALVNGALIALGASAILDNIVTHWILGIHRVIAGPWAGPVEWVVLILGAAVLGLGLWREARARRR